MTSVSFVFRFSVLIVLLLCCAVAPQDTASPATASAGSPRIPVPPLYKGGLASLWYNDHVYVQKEYGPFELLNFDNVPYADAQDTLTSKSWKLTAIGNFTNHSTVQFATLARTQSNRILLIFFEWSEASDSTRPNGVFYHTVLSKNKLLIRTKQSLTGDVDTLEFSCVDIDRRCGRCYLDKQRQQMVLDMTDTD